MEKQNPKPKIVEKLDDAKTTLYRLQMISELSKTIVKYPKSAESAAAALAALIYCAYALAKAMWGVDQAVKAIKSAVDIEAGADKVKTQSN